MREGGYKFRAWHPEWKKYIPLSNLSLDYDYSWTLTTGKNGKTEYRWFKKQDVVIEEYTGLKDKAGKEIYEGDVIFSTDDLEKYLVKFYKGMYCVCVEDGNYSPLYEYVDDSVVVGSLLEDPDILKNDLLEE